MARGFGVKEFKDMLASTKANQVRFKTPSEFGNRWLSGTDAFGNTLLRQVLMAIAQSEKEQNGQAGRAWLKNEVKTIGTNGRLLSNCFATSAPLNILTTCSIGKVPACMQNTWLN